jgi:multiple antibiotic resistance protein
MVFKLFCRKFTGRDMKAFWLCFVPLFVAVDAIGVLPLFVSLTEGMEKVRRQNVVYQSVVTATVVAVLFLWFGPYLLDFLGISVQDFMIAGGILLLVISLNDILTETKKRRQAEPESLGAVPIGIPLITGPAVLTTCILLTKMHGGWITTAAVVVNISLAGFIFLVSEPITRTLGRTGVRTISKLASLLLAAIAVMLIRKGVMGLL